MSINRYDAEWRYWFFSILAFMPYTCTCSQFLCKYTARISCLFFNAKCNSLFWILQQAKTWKQKRNSILMFLSYRQDAKLQHTCIYSYSHILWMRACSSIIKFSWYGVLVCLIYFYEFEMFEVFLKLLIVF